MEKFEANYHRAPPVTALVRYVPKQGRTLIAFRISGVGKPKKPMKEFSDRVLKELTTRFLWRGNTLHNMMLGVLAQEDFGVYNEPLEIVANSFLFSVGIESTSEKGAVIHEFGCSQPIEEETASYRKRSTRINLR